MRVLVACEFSGVVRRAFRKLGHDAWSCDLLPADDGPQCHFEGDILQVLAIPELGPWDLMIAHPPCTYLASSGLHWNKRIEGRELLTTAAVEFVRALLEAPVPRIALENPIGRISSVIRKPDQIIQPWQFGHPESKSTCLWLKELPLLEPTNVLTPHRYSAKGQPIWDNQTPSGQNKLGPSVDRWKLRSTTYSGVAAAMATQWGKLA